MGLKLPETRSWSPRQPRARNARRVESSAHIGRVSMAVRIRAARLARKAPRIPGPPPLKVEPVGPRETSVRHFEQRLEQSMICRSN
eukprot:9125202-Pyramimonas_sp.AAC.1